MATESVDEILDSLVDYVGAGVGNMTRKKAKQRLAAYYTHECARKVLEGRLDELLNIGLITHKMEGESPVVWQISDEIDERRKELEAELRTPDTNNTKEE